MSNTPWRPVPPTGRRRFRGSLALFDLLLKPDLKKRDRTRLNKVAEDLLAALKTEKLRMDNWREKEATKAEALKLLHLLTDF